MSVQSFINGRLDKWIGNGSGTQPAQVPAPAPDASSAPVPLGSASGSVQGEPVQGVFIDASSAATLPAPIAPVNISEAFTHTRDFRKLVDSFDEDKQTSGEWIVSKLFTALAYIMPVIFAYFVGMAIGDAFANGPFSFSNGYSEYVHVASLFVEFSVTMLCFATVAVFKRALKDRNQLGLCIVLAITFVALSILNSFAQLFLLEKHIVVDTAHIVTLIAVTFRSFASLIVDLASAIYLGVTGVRSLKKYLSDQRAKIEAVREVNQVEIDMGQTQIQAAMATQQAMMDMQSKAQRAATWNEIEALQSQAMIEQAKRNMRGDDGAGSYRRSRY